MVSRRVERLNEQLKREISGILRRDVRDPRVGTPTVTGVEVTPDLWMATVHVRLRGSGDERSEALEGLEAAAPFIRGELAKGLRIRRIPELRFQEDRTLESALRIEAILDDVRPEDGWEDDDGDGEEEDSTGGEGAA